MAVVEIGFEPYDSFSTIEDADLFLAADVVRAPGWAALLGQDDAKGRGLVSATRMMLALPWCVDPVPAPTDLVIAAEIVEVTAMLAADLLAKPQLFRDASGNSNVKSVKAGSAQVEFFAPVSGGPVIPIDLWNRLVRAGLVGCVSADGFEAPFVSGASAGCRPLGGRMANDWPVAEQDCD